MSTAAARLIELQEPDGCFPSEVSGPRGTFADRNGFTTARVLRALRGLPDEPLLDRLRSRALDFLERCRSSKVPGAFGFWPADARPTWADRLPADIDDTSIITVELLRHGRLARRDALRTVCTVLLRHRVIGSGELRPPWISPGAFLTWIGQPGTPNVVDCCVNANAAALMALVGATHLPGYREGVQTVLDGLDWAADDPSGASGDTTGRMRSLTPFYPSTGDLREAVQHAVECGAEALRPGLDRLPTMTAAHDPAGPGCCSSAYGATVWRCQALEEAQSLHGSVRAVTPRVASGGRGRGW